MLARTIHTIKGTAGSVGLPEVSEAGSEVERVLRNNERVLGAALPEALERMARLIRSPDNLAAKVCRYASATWCLSCSQDCGPC